MRRPRRRVSPLTFLPGLFFVTVAAKVGALEGSASAAFLRPETAQGIFVNFKNVREVSRSKVPFGIAQVGKAFRNEITPRNFIFRSREFEQMEVRHKASSVSIGFQIYPPSRGCPNLTFMLMELLTIILDSCDGSFRSSTSSSRETTPGRPPTRSGSRTSRPGSCR